jgi:hypothetical protein
MANFVSLQIKQQPEGEAYVLSGNALRRMRSPNSVRRPGVHDSYGLGWALVEIGGYDAIEHNGVFQH